MIDSDGFGRAVQMEVGAMLVGRIVNDTPSESRVVRGMEKGHFEYGGSTIILLLSKDRVEIRKDFQDILNKNITEFPYEDEITYNILVYVHKLTGFNIFSHTTTLTCKLEYREKYKLV